MPTRQNRRASKGKPKSSTTFDNKKNKPQRNGQKRQGKSRSQTPKPRRKQSNTSGSSFNTPRDTLDNQAGLTPPQARDLKNLKNQTSQQEATEMYFTQTPVNFGTKANAKKEKNVNMPIFISNSFIKQQYQQQMVPRRKLINNTNNKWKLEMCQYILVRFPS
ncbi:hypothetical protein ABPG72_021734 [Tetrahymena utriculariae]